MKRDPWNEILISTRPRVVQGTLRSLCLEFITGCPIEGPARKLPLISSFPYNQPSLLFVRTWDIPPLIFLLVYHDLFY